MLPIVVTVFVFLALAAVISLVGYKSYVRPARYLEQLGTAPATITVPGVSKMDAADQRPLAVRVIQLIGQQVPVSPADATNLQRDLIAAGYRSASAIPIVYGSKIVLAVAMIVVAFLVRGFLPDSNILRNVALAGFGYVGYLAPSLFLDRLVDARRTRIRLGLPDALDLMIVAVEAGLGLDQAILYVSRELIGTHKDVSEELGFVTLEMQAGKQRGECLRNLGERTGEPELKKLVAVLIQTDKFGTSVADSLRTHSDFMRVRRKQDAQERAAKVGVKLVFPIFFLILPAMMVVAAGPGLLQVFKHLFPLMNSFGK
jgi:tight adherence protein C